MGTRRKFGARLDNFEIDILRFLKKYSRSYPSTPTIAKSFNTRKDKIYSKLKTLENNGLVRSFRDRETRGRYYSLKSRKVRVLRWCITGKGLETLAYWTKTNREIEGERRLKFKSRGEISESPKFTVEGEYEKKY